MTDIMDAAALSRVGKPVATHVNELGPLADLLGTWIGNKGWNVIAVPGKPDFTLLVRPYTEQITFSSLGAPVPNRPGQFVFGLRYELRIADLETNQAMHLENGMWLLSDNGQDPYLPTIARLAAVPHGDSVLALGKSTVSAGPPQIPVISTLPDAGPQMQPGYTDAYIVPRPGINTTNPNANLVAAISKQKVLETTTLDVSTKVAGGGVLNTPFISMHANVSAFKATYWIEKVAALDGSTILQLQYSQQADLNFLPKFGAPGLIMWPHVNINTLIKQ